MAYTPKTWACGEKITAEKLNNIERGVASINSEYVPKEWNCGEKITAEALNHIEQGIADAECEPCRVLLFDETVTFTEVSGDWLTVTPGQNFDATFSGTFPGTWTLIVDDEEVTENAKLQERSDYYIGVPGTWASAGEYKIGCFFSSTNTGFIVGEYRLTIDRNYFSAGEHSVKIYKNFDA